MSDAITAATAVERARALLAAATPGELGTYRSLNGVHLLTDPEWIKNPANAELAAAAPELVAALVARVEKLEVEKDEWARDALRLRPLRDQLLAQRDAAVAVLQNAPVPLGPQDAISWFHIALEQERVIEHALAALGATEEAT